MSKIPQSFIKSVAFEISDDYILSNTPVIERHSGQQSLEEPNVFIGRHQHTAKFLEFLLSTRNKGVFLVTGFRGMGKTSFVNHVLNTYDQKSQDRVDKYLSEKKWYKRWKQLTLDTFLLRRRDKDGSGRRLKTAKHLAQAKALRSAQIIPIHLTITQNNPKELDILRLIVSSVYDKFRAYKTRNNGWYWLEDWFGYYKQGVLMVLLVGVPALIYGFYKPIRVDFERMSLLGMRFFTWDTYLHTTEKSFIAYGLGFIFLKLVSYRINRKENAFNRIKSLYERCYHTFSEESSDNFETSAFSFKFLANGDKRTRLSALADTKEIEYGLQQFLALADQGGLEFIFTFDELDKVDAVIDSSLLYEHPEGRENLVVAYEKASRDRKQAIINIIAGLKNFFTTAPARFIFIAGNEMFDASLADVSDRQSPISSIFTYIFNIESLLKEKDLLEKGGTINALSLSDGIELYVKKMLFGNTATNLQEAGWEDEQKKTLYQKAKSYNYRDENNKEQNDAKIYFVLQNFITYLTYRSNGSPKKLIKELHEFIKVGDAEHLFDSDQTIIALLPPNDGQSHTSRNIQEPKRYLYFNYYNQYRIGFINYLYRPFLIRYGRSFKLYSDNLIVSTPYLFDHLLKFHPFAFSMANLELVPEVLSANKTPSLRSHIRKIIEYLGGSHIREIEVGLFDYKFSSRTLNEITYLSRIYEQEAAAMNYTLDESYLVKLHVIDKIRDLRNVYAKVKIGPDNSQQVFSIAHLNATLGDLHFFDQEYTDAISAYSDAIRPLTHLSISGMNLQDFITLNRNRLKIGLCFEKINAYEDALAQYADMNMDATRFMKNRTDNEKFLEIKKNPFGPDHQDKRNAKVGADESLYHSAALSDLLQIILQGFLAQLFIQEKKSVAGISGMKLFMAIGSYFKITEGFLAHNGRNHIIKANAFLHAGNLMYFKNTDVHEKLHEGYNKLMPDSMRIYLNDLNLTFGARLSDGERPVLFVYLYILGLTETFTYSKGPNFIRETITNICNGANIATYILHLLENDLPKDRESFRGIRYNYLAAFLSNTGDSLLANYRPSNSYKRFEIETLFILGSASATSSITINFSSSIIKNTSADHDLTDILRCYSLAAGYYTKQGRAASAIFQYTKILYLLRLVLQRCPSAHKRKELIQLLERTVVKPALSLVSQNAEHTDRHMYYKATYKTTDKEIKISDARALNNLSNHPETREVVMLFNYIKIRVGDLSLMNPDHLKQIISPYNSFATQHSRLLELAFFARVIEAGTLRDLRRFDTIMKVTKDKAKLIESAKSKIIDEGVEYLYCRLSILQIMDIYGNDYWMGHSYLAYTHFRVAKYLKHLSMHDDVKNAIKDRLAGLLGKGSHSSLDTVYHYVKAKRAYEQAIQLHTSGDTYRSTVEDMIYLEDDFNDKAYHFGAALDRYLMINNVFKKNITTCIAEIDKDSLFEPDRFV